jgi:hypothetical protein
MKLKKNTYIQIKRTKKPELPWLTRKTRDPSYETIIIL